MNNLHISLSYAAGFYTLPFETLCEYAAKHNYYGVQLIPDQSPNLYFEINSARAKKINTILKENGLTASLHNVFYDINLTSLIPDVQHNSINITKKVIRLSKKLGAKHLTVHPGYIYPGWRSDPKQETRYWEAAKKGISEIVGYAEKQKIKLLFENGSYHLTSKNSPKSIAFHIGIDIEEFRRILDFGCGKIGVCFDIGKARASGIKFEDFIIEFGNDIEQVQFSSIESLEEFSETSKKNGLDLEKIDFVYEGKLVIERKKIEKLLKHGPC